MNFTRRATVLGVLAATALVSACQSDAKVATSEADTKLTKVYVVGAIHSTHRSSEKYSLAVLEQAIRKANPDAILTEIPPDRIEAAKSGFLETGEVQEPRTRVFPEYTDVVFPLWPELGFDLYATAGWTREMADNRRAALNRIENDPARAEQWAEHQAAYENYPNEIAGRGDDPLFIHTDDYDAIVERTQRPYQDNFDADLGPGGWTQINKAHTDLINGALDDISGQGKTALITFGAWHKYMILRAIAGRDDIVLQDTRELFE